MRKKTREALASARVEKDVENAYRAEILHHRSTATIDSPHGTDGYARWDTVRLLLEAKFKQDLKARVPVCNVLGQMLLYLKKFEATGDVLPNVLLVGDKDECFVLSTSSVQNFLNLDIDWTVAPSGGNPELTRALVEGVSILPYVYDIGGDFQFRAVLEKCETLSTGEQRQVEATENNLQAIFTYWVGRVFQDPSLTAVEQVDVFLRCLFQPKDVYPHPTKRGVLVVPGYEGTKSGGVLINADQYRSFFEHFCQGYKPSLVERFYAMKDRLMEEDARRRQGAFFTPRIWVDEAHKEMSRVLGPKWREECIVWDSAAGTANLTRDYQDWGCLLSSTAERPDVQVIKDQGWHRGHEVFHYDFLNPGMADQSPFFTPEDGDNLIPASVDRKLREAAKAGKRLVFFMNPPYGTAGVYQTYTTNKEQKRSSIRTGIANTVVNSSMKDAKLGSPSQQLYAQFMFQCHRVAKQYGFRNYTVGIFCKPTFMSSGSYKPFRDWWYRGHSYEGGFLFQANHFADVSGAWGISFTVWSSHGTTKSKADLPIRLTDERDFTVVTDGIKSVYNSDGMEASKWVREPVKGLKGADTPQMSSGLQVVPRGSCTLPPSNLGFMADKSNCVMYSNDETYLLSSGSSRNRGFGTIPPNWRRAVALYATRKLVQGNWINDKDEYRAPDESKPGYEQWVNDCHVYALIHRHNNCTAMRDIVYKGKTWRIKNHWFWRTLEASQSLYDTPGTPTIYRDTKTEPKEQRASGDVKDLFGDDSAPTSSWDEAKAAGDPYFAHLLETGLRDRLSPDAQHCLDLLDALLFKSLPFRENYAAGKPELHLTAWDAGLYQTKHLFRDLFPADWAELQDAFKALAARLQPGVYNFGFLKK